MRLSNKIAIFILLTLSTYALGQVSSSWVVPPTRSAGEPGPSRLSAEGRNVYISNLPADISHGRFSSLFRQFGPIERFRVERSHTRTDASSQQPVTYGFVLFESRFSAEAAIAAANREAGIVFENHRLGVSFSDVGALPYRLDPFIQVTNVAGRDYATLSLTFGIYVLVLLDDVLRNLDAYQLQQDGTLVLTWR